jgi:hypothetical protein
MKLPVSPEYLAQALKPKVRVGKTTLMHYPVGDLHLPTGKLVAFDPAAEPKAAAFLTSLPTGSYPVFLSVAQFSDDQRVAFATIGFTQQPPKKWQVLTLGDSESSHGFGVDSGVAGFIDKAARASMLREMKQNEGRFYNRMDAEMKKTTVDTWSWLNVPFGRGNLIAFSPGYGDGEYVTYLGFDAKGKAAVVVTDFDIVSNEKDTG